MLELGGPGRRAARRALRKGGPISPYMRSHAAIVAAAETGNPLAYTVPLVVAGQQILAAVNVDDSSALSSWFPFLSLLVAAAMLAVACGMALQVRHIRRNAVAAGLIPDIGGGAAGRECRQ